MSQTDSSVSSSETSSAAKKRRVPACVYHEGYDLELGLESVGKGWSPLIREAFEKKPDNCTIVQVKEKFGTLRIYYDIGGDIEYTDDPEYHKLINRLVSESGKICERCGQPGSLRNLSWIQTLCDEDYTKYVNEYKEQYGTDPNQSGFFSWAAGT
jgi:hypothetical protein